MDRKTIVIVAACLAAWLGLNALINKYYPPTPVPVSMVVTNSVTTASPGGITNSAAISNNTVTTGTTAAAAAAQIIVDTNTPEELMVVTNENGRYTFTSYGGGLKLVELLKYPETVRHHKGSEPGPVATLNSNSPAPTLAVLDGEAIQGNGIFQLTRTADGVRAEKQLTNGLSIIKDFSVGTNYIVGATIRLENHSGHALSLPEQHWVVGTATPMSADDQGQSEGMLWYDGTASLDISAPWFANRTLGCIPGKPRTEYREGVSNVVWAAVHNQFFALVVMPKDPATQVMAHEINLPPPSQEEIQNNSRVVKAPKGFEATLVYPAQTLAPNQSVEREFNLFAGPKEYQTLARIAARFHNKVDLVMGFGKYFGFVSKALLLGMNWLHGALSLPYGWCIIAITVIIKTLFWPLTKASTRSMKRMQALQPQMKAIQEKYKDDPSKMNRKVMEFMKENKVNPMGGCLPMMLQMPVFLGFFYMIRSAIELRGASFLWVQDLSRPDTLFIIPGTHFPFNLLPLIMGATMLWQSHMTPPSPGVDPAQQKIMRYMPMIFMVFLYNYQSGLALYWTVNNLLTVLQTKLTRAQQTAPAGPAPSPALTRPLKKKK